MDKIAQRLFGIAAIVASFAFLIQTTNPAQADAPTTINETGRYDIQFQAAHDGKTMNFYTLVWDTSSGRSKLYYGSVTKGSIVGASGSYQLPSSPLQRKNLKYKCTNPLEIPKGFVFSKSR